MRAPAATIAALTIQPGTIAAIVHTGAASAIATSTAATLTNWYTLNGNGFSWDADLAPVLLEEPLELVPLSGWWEGGAGREAALTRLRELVAATGWTVFEPVTRRVWIRG